MSKVLPTKESQNDPVQITKTIQILAHFTDKLHPDSLAKVANNLHHGTAQVREEAANFLLQVFDSDYPNGMSDLLPIQKA